MRYFTPELYVRGQSDDPAVADFVDREWEENLLAYSAHLDATRPRLPATLAEMLDRYSLHDADVLTVARNEERLTVVLQLDPPVATLLLTYTLVEPPRIDEAALPLPLRSRDHAQWLYDEVSVVDGKETTYEHSILLSNGWEVCVRFSAFALEKLEPVLLSEAAQRRLAAAQRIMALREG